MPRRRLRDLGIIQNPPNSEEVINRLLLDYRMFRI
ncbi:hypothetical protein Gotur_023389 [Gossypium turneri]